MKRDIFVLLAPISLVVAAGLATGCKKEEPPPPLPSAAPVQAAPAPLQLRPEDAGVKPAPVESAKPPVGHGSGGGGLGPCCAALQQNAASAPPPTNGYMLQAAAACQAMNAQGMGRAAIGQLLGMLRGAGMPAACK